MFFVYINYYYNAHFLDSSRVEFSVFWRVLVYNNNAVGLYKFMLLPPD